MTNSAARLSYMVNVFHTNDEFSPFADGVHLA